MFSSLRTTIPLISILAAVTSSSAQPSPHDSLRVSVADIRLDYCENDLDLAMATIHLNLRVSNYSKESVILSRKFGPTMDIKLVNEDGSLVYSPHPSYYETKPDELGKEPDDKLFQVVAPGSVTEREIIVGIPISRNKAHPVNTMPSGGTYRLSGRISSWPVYSDESRALRTRRDWRKYGFLVIAPINLGPVKITISPPRQLPVCVADRENRD